MINTVASIFSLLLVTSTICEPISHVTLHRLYKQEVELFFLLRAATRLQHSFPPLLDRALFRLPVLHAGFLSVKPGSDQVWTFLVPFYLLLVV